MKPSFECGRYVPLHAAVRRNDTSLVSLLLEHKCSADTRVQPGTYHSYRHLELSLSVYMYIYIYIKHVFTGLYYPASPVFCSATIADPSLHLDMFIKNMYSLHIHVKCVYTATRAEDIDRKFYYMSPQEYYRDLQAAQPGPHVIPRGSRSHPKAWQTNTVNSMCTPLHLADPGAAAVSHLHTHIYM